jgi:uncharacterized protein YhbP (UPF0306 family)
MSARGSSGGQSSTNCRAATIAAFPRRRWATAIERSNRPVGERRLRTVARELLDASTLCAIATVTSPASRAHINTAYFAWATDWRIVWVSDPRSRHSRNLVANRSVAVAVFDSRQTWGKPDRGIQLFGSAREPRGAAADAARDLYSGRFPAYRIRAAQAYRPYEFRPTRLKLFDERALGSGTFVMAKVDRDGRLTWERTEIYDNAGPR